MKSIKQVFPILDWSSRYKREDLNGDVFAGLTVGSMLIPQGMAYALIAGLPPVYGLYAAIIPQIVYAILGTSRQLSVAPVAMDSLLVAAGVSVLAEEGTSTYLLYAILLAFMVGLFQILLGLLKMGFITNLLSKPVISGFTSAAAIIIGLNQLKYLFGVQLEKSTRVYEILDSAMRHIGEIHWLTFAVGLGGIFFIFLVKKYARKLPGAFLVVVIGTALVYSLRWDLNGVSIVREIPSGLPAFIWPAITAEKLIQLIPLAITISIVAYMEAFSVAKAVEAKKQSYKIRPNQELVALGASNLLGSFFQAFPVTGGFSRTAVNFQSGANTPLASIISAVIVALTLLFLTPLFYFMPQAILASVIMVAVVGLIDWHYATTLWKENRLEFALLAATLLVTLNFNMVPGIVTGIVLSILLLLYKAAYPHIAILGQVKGHHEFRNIKRFNDLEVWEDTLIIRMDAPLTFININFLKDFLTREISKPEGKINTLIIDAGPISYLDATGVQGLRDLVGSLKTQGIELILCDVIGPVRDVLTRTGLLKELGTAHIFLDVNDAMTTLRSKKNDQFKSYAIQSND